MSNLTLKLVYGTAESRRPGSVPKQSVGTRVNEGYVDHSFPRSAWERRLRRSASRPVHSAFDLLKRVTTNSALHVHLSLLLGIVSWSLRA